ncbi:hypothetical protein CVIRNUC_006817 [Coccomyxa viridis]|uniref:Hydantoinase/oxoprolinase n=1 Tax=Coccomyxa viridis TaxID=1274662 RepID=A0AAV1I8C5_9CHLO|nr:hypothetical protein CVIRNUC_006817 [Coccomyxa viridis]
MILGIDVGGTSTDAVLLNAAGISGKFKTETTTDIFTGILSVIEDLQRHHDDLQRIELICLGTTHFINALIRQHELAHVTVLRLCGPATRALPPFCDMPAELIAAIGQQYYMLPGGYEYDGKTEIAPVSLEETADAVRDALAKGITSFVVSGVFSPTRSSQEAQVEQIIKEVCHSSGIADIHVTLSHEVGHIGLLEREAAAILNAALRPLASRVIPAIQQALKDSGIRAQLQLTSNDGTLITADMAQKLPVSTIQSGPVNSLRGAAALTGIADAIVIDIGGTTTDLGVLVKGLPRPAAAAVHIAGVRTNFAMPDVHSIGLGGGSLVDLESSQAPARCRVGPQSVGQHLARDALCFGGDTCTATDVAVALGRMDISGCHLPSAGLSPDHASRAWRVMQQMLEKSVDGMKSSKEDVPVIVVGGGAVLCADALPGASAVHRPEHADVANAIGAAIPQVSGVSEGIYELHGNARERARVLKEATGRAEQRAIDAGAAHEGCQIHSIEEVPLAYLPGGLTRVLIRVTGNLKGFSDVKLLSAQHQSSACKQAGQERKSQGAGVRHEESASLLAAVPAAIPECHESASAVADPAAAAPPDDADRQIGDDGVWTLSKDDVEAISTGCGILGAGGGGDPYINRLKVLRELDRGGVIRVIGMAAVPEGALVVEAGGMGAPTVGAEKLDAYECEAALLGHSTGPNAEGLYAVMSCEIGGGNGLEPLAIGARMGLPVVDADFMGRAFPELQMMTSAIYGHDLAPAVLADEKGNVVRVESAASPEWLERLLRPVCTAMGCAAGLSTKPMTGAELRRVAIPGTLTLAWRLGRAVARAHDAKSDPVQAVVQAGQGALLFSGKIVDVQRETSEGFVRGTFATEGMNACAGMLLHAEFQNENLVAQMDGNIIACVPDLICCIETDGGTPVSTEGLRYGLRVSVLALPAHPMLKTQEALAVVGPQAFGYTCSYEPVRPIVAAAAACV